VPLLSKSRPALRRTLRGHPTSPAIVAIETPEPAGVRIGA